MHCNKCPIRDAYAMFYIELPLVILAKMENYFGRHRGCADTRSSGTRFESPEICAAPQARITLSETRAGTLRWVRAEKSVCNGRCCRPGIAEISRYRRVGRGLPLRETKNTKFRTPTSQLEVEPRSMGWASFTVKSACVFWS